MTAFATLPDLHARIPDGIPAGAEARASAMLDDASAIIRSEAGKTWDGEEVPEIVKVVCLAAAKRAFLNPDNVESLSIDGHSASFANASPDVYLTRSEKAAIRRAGGKSALWTQATTRAIDDVADVAGVVTPGYVTNPPASEEYDPFTEAWPR